MNDLRPAAFTVQELRSLTLFKWRYSLQGEGFTPRQAAQLLFWKWRVKRQGLRG